MLLFLFPIVKVLLDAWMGEKTSIYMMKEFGRWRETPLAFAATGGMGLSATTVFRKLAFMLADKWNVNYICCLFWLRLRLCFFPFQICCDLLKGSLIINFPSWPILGATLLRAPLSEFFQLLVPSSCSALDSQCWRWQSRAPIKLGGKVTVLLEYLDLTLNAYSWVSLHNLQSFIQILLCYHKNFLWWLFQLYRSIFILPL